MKQSINTTLARPEMEYGACISADLCTKKNMVKLYVKRIDAPHILKNCKRKPGTVVTKLKILKTLANRKSSSRFSLQQKTFSSRCST